MMVARGWAIARYEQIHMKRYVDDISHEISALQLSSRY